TGMCRGRQQVGDSRRRHGRRRAGDRDSPNDRGSRAVRASGPMTLSLMLATLTDRRDFGDDWFLERKFDGERCVAVKRDGEVALQSRTGKDLTGRYPEVSAAVAGQRARELLLDGEVVAFDGQQTSFGRLQQRLGVSRPSAELIERFPVVYCVFDVL